MVRRLGILAVTLGLALAGVSAPLPATAADKAAPAAAPAKLSGPVNVNTATMEELMQVQGIGEATARAILEYRKQHGSFQKIEDLVNVKGIGEKKLANLRSQVTIK